MSQGKWYQESLITFHNPTSAVWHGAIPEAQNPHKTIAAYAKDLDIVVFNGHVHTTELTKWTV